MLRRPAAKRARVESGRKDVHRPAAVMTMCRDEALMLPVFLRYYARHFEPHEIFVLDHLTADDSLKLGLSFAEWPARKIVASDMQGKEFVCVDLQRAVPPEEFNPHFCPDFWRPDLATEACKRLFAIGFEAVIFVDVDEIVAVDPQFVLHGNADETQTENFDHRGETSTLRCLIDSFVESDLELESKHFLRWPKNVSHLRCRGYEVHHEPFTGEQALNFAKPVLAQRTGMFKNSHYSKPCLVKAPTAWAAGFHTTKDSFGPSWEEARLLLLHLHRVDFDTALSRHRFYKKADEDNRWDPAQEKKYGFQYRKCDLSSADAFVEEFWGQHDGTKWIISPWGPASKTCGQPEEIPDAWKLHIVI